jgi:predicted DNA-binding transcriptional regulator AlpA
MVFQKCATKPNENFLVPKATGKHVGPVQERPNNASEEICVSKSEQQSSSRYFNTKQAAFYLGLSTQYLEIARHKGHGPQYIKLAKAVRYRVDDLDDWMADHIQHHTAEGAA